MRLIAFVVNGGRGAIATKIAEAVNNLAHEQSSALHSEQELVKEITPKRERVTKKRAPSLAFGVLGPTGARVARPAVMVSK